MPLQRKVHLWNKVNFDQVKEEFKQFSSTFVANNSIGTNVNLLWETLRDKCLDIADHIPSKCTSIRQHQPWINCSIKQLSRLKQRRYNKARLTGLAEDWEAYKKLKRYTQRQCKEAYDSYVNSIVSPESSNNPKRFWSFIKSKRTDYCGVGALQHNGCTYSDNYTKCNILNQYFALVFTIDDSPNTPMSSTSLFPDIPAISVTLNGVITLLQNLKPYKASGPDKYPHVY